MATRRPMFVIVAVATAVAGSAAVGLAATTGQAAAAANRVAGVIGSAAVDSAARLIPNADFEEPAPMAGPSYAAPGWTSLNPGSAVSTDDADTHSGRQALRVSNAHVERSEAAESTPIAVLPGETVTLSAWAKVVSGAPGSLTLQFWDASGRRIERDYGRVTAPATSRAWAQVSVSRVAPDDALRATMVLSANDVGVTLWDDVSVRSDAPSAYQVPDNGFEDTRDDQVHTHWTYAGAVRPVTAASRPTDVWANDRALSVGSADATASKATSFLIPVVPDDHLTATAWAKVASGAPGTFSVEFVAVDRGAVVGSPADYRTTVVGRPVSGTAAASGRWSQVLVEANVPAGATHLRFTVASAGAGVTLWDDVRVAADSDAALTAYRPAVGEGSVLFVGDQRVEGYTGLSRVVHQGTKAGDPALAGLGNGVVLGYPGATSSRTVSTVMRDADGTYRMWFAGAASGTMTSPDGVRWDESTAVATPAAPTAILANPRYGQPGQPRYLGLGIGFADDPDPTKRTQNYYVYVSDDGVTWTRPTPNLPAIYGRDTAMVSWDPVDKRFVATVKQWFMTTASPGTYRWEPRSAWVSFSEDFTTWTQPRLVLQSDVRDYRSVAAANPTKRTTSDIYSLPAFRYGEQILGLPWMQDVTDISRILNMGQDVSTEHIELASSQDYVTWSRPARDPIIAKGAPGEWDWGFMMTSTSGFLTVGDQVRLYYGSYAGEHACTQARITAGVCDVLQVPSRVGLVTWPRDRFVSLRSNASTAGTVTTKVLDPAASSGRLHLNASGMVRVEALDAAGQPIPGWRMSESVASKGDSLDAVARWRGGDHLPNVAGGIRLRFQVTGDLYSYAIK